jgi:spore maturation protein SpmB
MFKLSFTSLILCIAFTFTQTAFSQITRVENVNYSSSNPTTNAPTPPARKTLDVVSIFSDSYNNITGANYNPYWEQSGFASANLAFQPTGSGNAVLAYPNFNYQGIEFNSVQDITSMEFLHLDIWTVDGVIPSISVISSGTELPKAITNGDGAWQSIEIPVAGITGDLTNAIQLKFTGGNGASNAIYVDNLYFYKNPTASGEDATISALEVDGVPIVGFTPNSESYLFALPGGTTTVPQITLATTADASASATITQATAIPGDATVLVTAQNSTTTKTYRVSFYIGAPNVNAPTPPAREVLDVVSIFSDSYNNISGANYNPDWQQNGFGTANPAFKPTGSGNAVLAYPNFNYQGIEFNSVQDISAMEFLHLDIWTVKGVIPAISVISSGTAIPKTIPNGDGQWQSIDIPVAGITSDVTRAIQLMFNGGNGASNAIYVDNLYFYKSPTASGEDATISVLEVDGVPIVGFTPNSESYLFALPGGTTTVPQITLATTTDASASATITQATAIPGDATVLVAAQNGTTTKTYSVSFYIGSPNIDAPAPSAREVLDVISIFSDSYNNITGANYTPDWQQSGFNFASSIFEPANTGNTALAYPNFNYQGIEFNSVQDLTSMEFLHLDIWTVKGVIPKITVLSSGTEIPHAITNRDGAWQSIDIAVAGITGDLTNVIQLKFTGGNGFSTAIYVDNIYFWREPSLGTNDFEFLNFKAFPNPSQTSWTIKTENITITSIQVFDVLGKNVVSLFPNTIETVIDGSSLKAGMYVVQIKTLSGIKSIKLIKK